MRNSEEFIRTLTKKGQVTIPVEVRKFLGIGPHDKVAFVVEYNQVLITPTKGIVERTAGAFRSEKPARTVAELRKEAEKAIADETLERFNRTHQRRKEK